MARHELIVQGFDLNQIRNRNERRVVEQMKDVLDQYYGDYLFEQLDIEDIYALTLNLLPARYAQHGSIVISNRLSDYEIRSKVREAADRVLAHPTRSEKD